MINHALEWSCVSVCLYVCYIYIYLFIYLSIWFFLFFLLLTLESLNPALEWWHCKWHAMHIHLCINMVSATKAANWCDCRQAHAWHPCSCARLADCRQAQARVHGRTCARLADCRQAHAQVHCRTWAGASLHMCLSYLSSYLILFYLILSYLLLYPIRTTLIARQAHCMASPLMCKARWLQTSTCTSAHVHLFEGLSI